VSLFDAFHKPAFRIPVEDQKSGCRVEWKCFPELAHGPTARRMHRDVEVQNPPAIMPIKKDQ